MSSLIFEQYFLIGMYSFANMSLVKKISKGVKLTIKNIFNITAELRIIIPSRDIK